MTPAEFYITKREGDVININRVATALSALKDGTYLCRIESARKRSNSQNRFYWLIMTQYVQPGLYDIGYREIKTKEQAHEFCKSLFLKRKVINEISGEEVIIIRHTHELTKSEFNEYMEEIAQWSAEYLSIVLPTPNQQLTIEV